jgi:predicted HicB family RNase H-like nuclease
MRITERETKKDTTFTMRMPSEIHSFLEKYAYKNYTSMSNIIIQLILKLKKEDDTK